MTNKSTAYVLALLRNLPPILCEDLISDANFRTLYGISAKSYLSFGDMDIKVERSELYDEIRNIYSGKPSILSLTDKYYIKWTIELIEIDKKRFVAISNESTKLILPSFYGLCADKNERLNDFRQSAEEVNLPKEVTSKWEKVLTSRILSDDEVDELQDEIKNTPIYFISDISEKIGGNNVSIKTLVPNSVEYYYRLVGNFQESQNILEYSGVGLKKHIELLMEWNSYEGFLRALLLSSYPINSNLFPVEQLTEEDILGAYEWLKNEGDLISKVGAIELGISILEKYPQIEPIIKCMIEQVRDDDPDDENGRFKSLSALVVLVEGEISRTGVLLGHPPFGRRLASIAHASLLERGIIKSKMNTSRISNWAMESRAKYFYFNNIADMRLEPRWSPSYIYPRQLKAEFIGRIVNVGKQFSSNIASTTLFNLLFSEEKGSLISLPEMISSFIAGPLEGNIPPQNEPPEELINAIEEQLDKDVLHLNSFILLVNSALFYKLNPKQAELAAKALRSVKHQIRQVENKEKLFSVFIGLANVASMTRSEMLAEEIKILIRRYCHNVSEFKISAEEAMEIGLTAAAAYQNKSEWCKFVGEFMTELAFQSLEKDEAQKLHFHLKQLCRAVPELWSTCGRAEAALVSCIGK